MLDRFDLYTKIIPGMVYAEDWRLALAVCETRKRRGPRPATQRRFRGPLVEVGVPVPVEIAPTICNDFLVTRSSYIVMPSDSFFEGNIGRYDAAFKLGKVPGVDVAISSQGEYAYIFTDADTPIQVAIDRQGGDPLPHGCDGCWLIHYCDFMKATFTLRDGFGASALPLDVGIFYDGVELCYRLDQLDPEKCRKELDGRGIVDKCKRIIERWGAG